MSVSVKIHQMRNRVNVLYLTTRCNMECDYCYEEASRNNLPEQVEVTEELIDRYLTEISYREFGKVSTVVIMGGEVFLKPHLLKYVFNKMGEIDHMWGVSISTNGTLIFDCELLNTIFKDKKDNISLTIEISYDGSGHFRRVFRNSKQSTKLEVEKSIDVMVKNKIPLKISYTIHKGNYNNFLYDMVYILERWGKDILAIKLSPFKKELEDNFGINPIDKLGLYANRLYAKYKVPICNFSCNVCKKCDKSEFIGNAYFSPKGDNIKYEESTTRKNFDKW